MAAMLPPGIWADLIGKRYVHRGRGPDAYDCWGLMMEVFRRLGKHVPDVAYPNADDVQVRLFTEHLADLQAHGWKRLDKITPGCGLLFRRHSLPQHVGVAINEDSFIHSTELVGSVLVSRLDTGFPRYRPFLIGAFDYAV